MSNILKGISTYISKKVNTKCRQRINRRLRLQLKNHEFSLFANTCNGGVISHDLGLRFNSPFVNLWLYPQDYIRFLQRIDYYVKKELEFYPVGWGGCNYPVGRLDDINIYFMHYPTVEDARNKWNERCKRINRENLFVLMTEKDGCTHDDMVLFDSLNIANKVLLTHVPCPEIKCSFYIKGFEEQNECGILSNWVAHNLSGKRYLDQFDWVKWFNSGNENR